ncbi:sigma-70 family RNA polymerase sigma factor [Phytohabitans sp. ZYX-F-186]|uniref:Sigma-70 family RNA polymerase sigma factor n=1 Tax=Phytohabitans maris TaxID=3071409 RepID=A0ABU0ZMG3_9ACTN|nr:sigma-70 family RNA polymerase sigma factor [Phytohabitans sp. ZYX-F-186]MDQ7908231.1 sigma-70 family RNA polymerase sigma factor [Phytohabitans sp. ZYX-F-186]
MTTTSTFEDQPDADLVAAARAGDSEAFAELFRRHRTATYRAAAAYATNPAERDDLVAESFTRLLTCIRSGRGPEGAIMPYLNRMLRNMAIDRWRLDRVVVPCEHPPEREPHYDEDGVVAAEQAALVAQAFARLPKRWQDVLWYTEVDQEPPARVAPLLGITPNAVAALAYRAREGLRQAYLQLHTPAQESDEGCRTALPHLGAWIRGGLSPRTETRVGRHLEGCGRCRTAMGELAMVNAEISGGSERPEWRRESRPVGTERPPGTGRAAPAPAFVPARAAGDPGPEPVRSGTGVGIGDAGRARNGHAEASAALARAALAPTGAGPVAQESPAGVTVVAVRSTPAVADRGPVTKTGGQKRTLPLRAKARPARGDAARGVARLVAAGEVRARRRGYPGGVPPEPVT